MCLLFHFYSITPPVMLSRVCSFRRVIYWKSFFPHNLSLDIRSGKISCRLELFELSISNDEGLTSLLVYGLTLLDYRLSRLVPVNKFLSNVKDFRGQLLRHK